MLPSIPGPTPVDASGQPVTEFPLPAGRLPVAAITAGPNGAVWFADQPAVADTEGCAVASITSTGAISEHPIQLNQAQGCPEALASDGTALWYLTTTLPNSQVIRADRMSADGTTVDYAVAAPTELANGPSVGGLAVDQQGDPWIGDLSQDGPAIDQVTPGPTVPGSPLQVGTATQHPLPSGSLPAQLAMGPDHNIWFTDNIAGIGRMTQDGTAASFPAPGGQAVDLISPGPSGIWFTYGSPSGNIGFSTLDGHITAPVASVSTRNVITGLAVDHDGTVWYSVSGTRAAVWRINACGHAQEIPMPSSRGSGEPPSPSELVIGADGNIWFLDFNTNAIGRVTVSALSPLPPCSSGRMTRPAQRDPVSSGTSAVPARGRTLRPNHRA